MLLSAQEVVEIHKNRKMPKKEFTKRLKNAKLIKVQTYSFKGGTERPISVEYQNSTKPFLCPIALPCRRAYFLGKGAQRGEGNLERAGHQKHSDEAVL